MINICSNRDRFTVQRRVYISAEGQCQGPIGGDEWRNDAYLDSNTGGFRPVKVQTLASPRLKSVTAVVLLRFRFGVLRLCRHLRNYLRFDPYDLLGEFRTRPRIFAGSPLRHARTYSSPIKIASGSWIPIGVYIPFRRFVPYFEDLICLTEVLSITSCPIRQNPLR